MTEVKNSKEYDVNKIGFWSFGFRYCLGFRALDLGFNTYLGEVICGGEPKTVVCSSYLLGV